MGATKITSIVLISIILTVVLVAVVNVGVSIFLERPDYSDYERVCSTPMIDYSDNKTSQDDCNTEYDQYQDAIKNYNQIRFYIFAGLGFILLLSGLFIPEIITKITGLASGGILVAEGIVMNFENKIAVFISLIAILVIFGVLGIKVVKRMK